VGLLMAVLLFVLRMLRDSTAVAPVLVAAAVRDVRVVGPLGAVETVVPLAVNVDEAGTVLRAQRL